jgi:O-antigen ligase
MGIFAILFFWRERQKLLRSLLLYAGLALMSLAIIASGSRKNFIAEVLFFNLWIFYCYGRRIFRTRFGIIGLFIFLLSIYYFVDFTLTSTITGERLFAVQAEYNRGSGLSKRQAMYIKGFQLINENPVFGVGLDQYIIIAEDIHGYSHSDFIEVTAGTGFVGALIYYSIYFVLWRRIVWISKRIRKPLINYHIGLIKSSVIMIFLLGLGVPYYYFKITWIYLAAVVGYTWHIERKMRKVIYVNRLKRLAESRARVRLRAATSSYH